MVNIPIIQDIETSPFAGLLGGLGEGLGGGISQSIENRLLGNSLKDVDINDPLTIQDAIAKAKPSLRPKIAELLNQQIQIRNAEEKRQRTYKQFETEQQQTAQQLELNKLKLDDVQRAREAEFTNLVDSAFPGDEIAKASFVDLANNFSDIKDPRQKYGKTLEKYNQQLQVVDKLFKSIGERKPNIFGGFNDLKEPELNRLSKDVSRLRKNGISEQLIESGLSQGNLSQKDLESVFTPKLEATNSLLKQIPIMAKGEFALTPAPNLNLINKLLSKAIKKGASLDLLYNSLLEKGYDKETSQEIIRRAVEGVDLTPRQQKQIVALQQERTTILQKIFGR